MIVAANRQRVRSPESRAKMAGARNPNWRGDEVGYIGLHIWLRRHKTRTGVCERCGATPSPMKGMSVGTDFANKSGEYRRDVDDFWELCQVCHARVDRGEVAFA